MTPSHPRPTVFISHTTRDRRDHRLAHDLAAGLRVRGATTWIAPDSIPIGEEWEPALVKGIVRQCTHFLAILSAESVRAPWVLREIDMALTRRADDSDFVVLPLWVGDAGEFAHRAALDQLRRLPYHDRMADQIDALAAALRLRPSSQVYRPPTAADDFVGREYVFDAVGAFVASYDRGYFFIQGDPGSGKTALLAEFVARSDAIAHYNIASQGINTAAEFLRSICEQVTTRHDLDRPPLSADDLDGGTVLSDVLGAASTQLQDGERLVVAVDALDEVDMSSQREGSSVLYLPPHLPEGVFFVLTARTSEPLPKVYTPIERYDLADHADDTMRDVADYIGRQATREPLRSWLSEREMTVDDFVVALSDKSAGNFMYLHYVLPEIAARGPLASVDIDELPVGLEAYYRKHWKQMGMTARPLPRTKLQVVYVLSVTPHPITVSVLTFAIRDRNPDVDEFTVLEILTDWDQFLHDRPGPDGTEYSIYHASFRDFLHDQETTQAAKLTIPDVAALVAEPLFADLFPDSPTSS